jgi:hypothetical protein
MMSDYVTFKHNLVSTIYGRYWEYIRLLEVAEHGRKCCKKKGAVTLKQVTVQK